MDKISSYPLEFLEAVLGQITLGSSAQWLGKPNIVAPLLIVGRPYGPIVADLEQFQNCTDFQIKLRRFPKTKLRGFSNIR